MENGIFNNLQIEVPVHNEVLVLSQYITYH